MASCPAENQYIRDLYFCTVTLPVVGDESLPESHAKYQYTKGKKGKEASPQEAKDMEIEGLKRIERVKPLVPYCCLDVRRRMTNDFNERLQSFVLDPSNAISGTSAQLHVVDLNQYIRQQVDSDEVDSQYVTDDPVSRVQLIISRSVLTTLARLDKSSHHLGEYTPILDSRVILCWLSFIALAHGPRAQGYTCRVYRQEGRADEDDEPA